MGRGGKSPAARPARSTPAAVCASPATPGGGSRRTLDGLTGTGDLGHLDGEGRLFIDGRADDMIVSGGENVFPGEVENLLGGHPDVAEVSVTGVDDEKFGQRLAAYVVRTPGADVTEDDLKAYVKKHLARYKVPRDVQFVPELPRTSTGKVRAKALPA
jgi:fatty-acyl-CoA synthase